MGLKWLGPKIAHRCLVTRLGIPLFPPVRFHAMEKENFATYYTQQINALLVSADFLDVRKTGA
jgi:hypothetical protein